MKTTPGCGFLFGLVALLSIGACQSKHKSAELADAALPVGTDGAERAPFDTVPDTVDSAITAGVMVSPTSADFGKISQGASSTPTVFTVTSTGLAIALNPTVTGPFAIVSNRCGIVEAGKPCTIDLSFNPVALGQASGVLTVAAGVNASLTGTCAALPPAILAFEPPATVAVSTMIGVSSSPITFNLINSGGSATGALTLTPGGNVDQFMIDNQCIEPLAANSICRISVVCRPTSSGSKVLTLTVTDANSPTTSVVATVNEQSAGGPAGPSIYGTGDFGTVAVGATSPAHDFTIVNPGQTDTDILTVTVTDSQFVVTSDGCSNLPLASGKSCTFSIVFVPSAPGTPAATVRVSIPGLPSGSLPIKGIGAPASSGEDGGTYVDGGTPG